ncbi:MAG: inorganic phosphate transporter [Muribaculaceae bacterium]
MDLLFLGIILFLFVLAIFDLTVGVSNDAVNFLTSAIGTKAAKFRTIIIIAAVGVFAGAVMSNGMMDIARHGIFRPEHFSFYDLICIYMAVMVTDIILLDVFNSLGMPTSTTVSMVFELLGAAFAVSVVKMADAGAGLGMMDFLNTEKALSVIIGIFLSVAIAFIFGTVVQFIARMVFSFGYNRNLKWKIGIYGGLATTAIIYFLLLKGAKDMSWMTPELKAWIKANTWLILGASFVVCSVVMQLLYWLRVNVLKVVVLIGTFALAMAFAGNDLVNFIGVPLAGYSSYSDYVANGAGEPTTFMMGSLNESANTPVGFLLAAGVIMVVALATSKKAHNVTKTAIGLGSQTGGDEIFGSSRIARSIVRMSLSVHSWLERYIPRRVLAWLSRRFDTSQMSLEQGAAFDLVRGSVNLMLAGMLIAAGTSMKLPLSTTFVTFMVAMGTSLADRAWGRESAIFRITGVISVVGGWFITAGVAFIGAALVASLMYWGGAWAMIPIGVVALALIIRSNLRYKAMKQEDETDTLFQTILTTEDASSTWGLLNMYIDQHRCKFVEFASASYMDITQGFIKDDVKTLSKVDRELDREKQVLKSARRKETLCLRRIPAEVAITKSAWFHLSNNSCLAMNYNLRRMAEVCKEHVENNFHPLPRMFGEAFEPLRAMIMDVMKETIALDGANDVREIAALRTRCDAIKDALSAECRSVYDYLRSAAPDRMTVTYVYLNLLQESREMVSSLRKLLSARSMLHTDVTPA